MFTFADRGETQRPLPTLKSMREEPTATRRSPLRLTMPAKISYGFLILALGLMVTDVCKLVLAPSQAAFASSANVHRNRNF